MTILWQNSWSIRGQTHEKLKNRTEIPSMKVVMLLGWLYLHCGLPVDFSWTIKSNRFLIKRSPISHTNFAILHGSFYSIPDLYYVPITIHILSVYTTAAYKHTSVWDNYSGNALSKILTLICNLLIDFVLNFSAKWCDIILCQRSYSVTMKMIYVIDFEGCFALILTTSPIQQITDKAFHKAYLNLPLCFSIFPR